MHRPVVRFSAFLALTAALSCTRPPQTLAPTPASPKRIVSLTPALTETLFAIGAGDRVVGVTQYCDFPEAAKSRPKVGGYVNPSVEAVIALTPDLVVVSPGPGNRDAALAMQRAGLRVEIVPAETLDESIAAIELVARLTGDEPEGIKLATALRARLAAIAERVASVPRVRTLFSIQTDPIIAAGRDTLPSQLLEVAGGTNVVELARYPRLDVEAVAAAKPELILQARMDVSNDAAHDEESFWKRWPSIPAVAAGRVVVLQSALALRPGPRIAEAAEELATILHRENPGTDTR